MTRAPVADGGTDRNKALALAGQAIFDLGGNDAVVPAVDQPRFGQRLQFAGEHAGRDFRAAVRTSKQAGSDLAIALGTVLQVPDDPQLVLAADHLLERRDRTAAAQCRFRLRHAITSNKALR